MICPECGAEVQIVPDYNPLEDVLTREVRGSVEGATRQIRTGDLRRARRENTPRNVNSTRVLSQGEMDRIREERRERLRRSGAQGRQNGSNTGRNTGNVRRNTDRIRQEQEHQRKNAEERRDSSR